MDRKNRIIALFLMLPIFHVSGASFAHAQSQMTLPRDYRENTEASISIKRPSKYKVTTDGYLRFEGMKYQSSVPENPQLDQSMLASMQLKTDIVSSNAFHRIDFGAGKYVDLGGSKFGVHELFSSGYSDNHNTQWSLGRKIEFWSQVDQDWQLGMWQPKSLLDSLRPDDQGLTGLFYRHKQGEIEILGFASPLFIPTTKPDVQEKDGTLVTDSRWYRTPSSSFPLFGKQTKIVYSLNIPEAAKLTGNPGAGGRIKIGGDSDGFWGSANYGYKPQNNLLLKYKKNLYLPEYDPQTGAVEIAPDVGYQHLGGVDLGYQFPRSMIAVSYLEDRPIPKAPDAPYVLQNPQPMKAYSVHMESNFDFSWFDQPVALNANYLKIEGGGIIDYDSAGTSQGAIFDQRFNFSDAASIRADFSTSIFRKRMMSTFKYMREFSQKGSLWNGEVNFYAQKSLALILGADILGVDDNRETNLDTGFLNQFRANDRVYGGMNYVF